VTPFVSVVLCSIVLSRARVSDNFEIQRGASNSHLALLPRTAWRCPLFVYTQSATGRFRLPFRRSGTVCQATLYLLYLSIPSAAYWRLFCLVFRCLIWSSNCFSLVCNLWRSGGPIEVAIGSHYHYTALMRSFRCTSYLHQCVSATKQYIYKFYFANKKIQNIKYTKSTSYTQTIRKSNASHWSQ